MNKILVSILFFTGYSSISQNSNSDSLSKTQLFDRWSLEFNLGQNKPIRPFTKGYYSVKPNTYFILMV